MTSPKDQLRKLIEQIVEKEVRRIIPTLVPQVVKEVMVGMIMESEVTPPQYTGNSSKRIALEENVNYDDLEEYPTMGGRTMTTSDMRRAMVGWDGEDAPSIGGRGGSGRANLITVDSAMSENGLSQIPIPPDKIPDHVLKAMNKDYSQVMKKLNLGK